ncbi:MAG: Radical SAM superfamily protein [Methanomassiliicoccales archaeon PtaU1.Bin124]|nr:MAG: Radical SAM superfamily protein [Methanomassiliicoccales archaeon PtaU1.Bin124]
MHFRPFGADSLYTSRLPLACRHCRRGAKMVLFITGRCDQGCFYCPLSARKKGSDSVYANELLVQDEADVLEEARLIKATGTGITGGDPLCVPDRTVRYIRLLKSRFGGTHHIHLYTSTVDPSLFRELEKAGLDELRIHPMVKNWTRLDDLKIAEAVRDLDIPVGFEVPAIPGMEKETAALIRYAQANIFDFVNLNELEFSETNAEKLKQKGFEIRDDLSSAVKGSAEMAVMLTLDDAFNVPIHFCSSKFKDRVQLRNRIMRRGRSIARDMDVLTDEGTLIKGVIETNDPLGAGRMLGEQYDVPANLLHIDTDARRLEVAPWVLEEIAKELPWNCYMVEEYPTADRLEVERRPLNQIKVRRK